MNREHDRKLEHEVFEKYGEDTVRRLLREGRIVNQRAIAAQAWLDELEEARRAEAERKAEAVQTEQMELARVAKDAAVAAGKTAEHAVVAAERANRRATIALAVAVVTMIAALASIGASFGLAHAPPARVAPSSRGSLASP
jgi:hypothetical protein